MGENFDKKVLEWKSNIEDSMEVTVSLNDFSVCMQRCVCLYIHIIHTHATV